MFCTPVGGEKNTAKFPFCLSKYLDNLFKMLSRRIENIFHLSHQNMIKIDIGTCKFAKCLDEIDGRAVCRIARICKKTKIKVRIKNVYR